MMKMCPEQCVSSLTMEGRSTDLLRSLVERVIIGDVFFVRDWLLRRDRMTQGFRPTFVGRPVLVALKGLYQRREHLRS